MPAWFDLFSLDPTGQEDDRGIEKSKQIITNLIEQEINNGIDPSRIILGKQTNKKLVKSNKSTSRKNSFDQKPFFCNVKNGQKSIFELRKSLKLNIFHEN